MGSSSRKKGSKKRRREEEEDGGSESDDSTSSSGTSSGTSSDSSEDERRHKRRRKHKSSSKSKRRKKESSKKDKKKRRDKEDDERGDEESDRARASSKKNERKASSSSGLGGLVETEEERAARKAAKEAKKIAAHFGYTAHSNPFGDANLHQQFVWKAKEKQQSAMGGGGKNKAEEAERRLELIREIEKVRKRREDREKELEEMDRLKAEEARLREAAMYDDWERKEEEFHLEQARIRSKIRLIEGREKPIDTLAKNLLLFGAEADGDAGAEGRGGIIKYRGKSRLDLSNLEAELREPYLIFENLSVEQLQDLQHDIREYQHLEAQGPNKDFWAALSLVCKDELAKAGALPGKDALTSGGVHSAVAEELEGMFGAKSVADLEKMRSDIQARLDRGEAGLDVDYWENVLAELKVFRARAFLREQHQQMLLQQLQKLEERKRQLAREKEEKARRRREEGGGSASEEEEEEEEDGPRQEAPAPEPENTGYDDSAAALALVSAERGKGLGKDEGVVGKTDEVDLAEKTYWWHDKYRPRKPRYFNRVKTGWDWNMYNRTHYDRDNPPPKTVQGYKFNIFYPDLIDKTKTPQFFIEPCEDPQFCIIRFHAGPPYEDVAFKIINREWERGHRRGFKCLFERGILSLYFNFKRLRYRR